MSESVPPQVPGDNGKKLPPPPTFAPYTTTAGQKAPGIVVAAFVLSLLGVLCGVTAIPGLILGVIGIGKAKAAGKGKGLAIASIIISGILIAAFAIGLTAGAISGGSQTSTSSSGASVSKPSAQPTRSTRGSRILKELNAAGFTCDQTPRGLQELTQCRKGTYEDAKYGPSPVELMNIWFNYEGANKEYLEGYLKPATLKTLKPLGISSFGKSENGTFDVTSNP